MRRNVGVAPEVREFGTVEWAVREGHPAGAETTVGVAVFEAGRGNVEHVHPNCEEVVYVLEGEVLHTLGAQSVVLRAGDLIVVPRGVAHRLANEGATPARTYITFSSPDRKFVAVENQEPGA